ncbi:hypothetical protein F5Y13DRAFT_193543 [Hypoxylon sp. FL1857]|nr:hypothetical protein F5Y13DRAFT_193543 [Hypoxylon sp. FL1857]
MSSPSDPGGTTNMDPAEDSPFQVCTICTPGEYTTATLKLPCGHAFHDVCILQWFYELGGDGAGRCPYCRATPTCQRCGDILPLGLFKPGANLQNTALCHSCDLLSEIQCIIPLVTGIWWGLQILYTEEVGQRADVTGPHSIPDNAEVIIRMKQMFHRECLALRDWLTKTPYIMAKAWLEVRKQDVHDPGYLEDVYGPWEDIPTRALDQLREMFPPQEDPEGELDNWAEPLLSKEQLAALSITLQQFLRGLDYEGTASAELYELNLEHMIMIMIEIPRMP